jgi:hypothetical protein
MTVDIDKMLKEFDSDAVVVCKDLYGGWDNIEEVRKLSKYHIWWWLTISGRKSSN